MIDGPEKVDYTCLPFEGLEAAARVRAFGISKHGESDWKTHPPVYFLRKIFRHSVEIARGRFVDDESGLPHAAHIAVDAMMLVEVAIIGAKEG